MYYFLKKGKCTDFKCPSGQSLKVSPAPCQGGKCKPTECCDAKSAKSCDASVAPANGTKGDCTATLASGETCQPTCNTGYTVSGKSSCKAGKLTAAACDPNKYNGTTEKCPNWPPGSGGNVVSNDFTKLGRTYKSREMRLWKKGSASVANTVATPILSGGEAYYTPFKSGDGVALPTSQCKRLCDKHTTCNAFYYDTGGGGPTCYMYNMPKKDYDLYKSAKLALAVKPTTCYLKQQP
jgi:hypothetical protein